MEARTLLFSGGEPSDVLGQLRARVPEVGEYIDSVHFRLLEGFASQAKQGAQGAALIADGLSGGRHRELVTALGIREAQGTVLDHLYVISREQARRRLGLA